MSSRTNGGPGAWSLRGLLSRLSGVLVLFGALSLGMVIVSARAMAHSDHELTLAIESVRSVQQLQVSLSDYLRHHEDGDDADAERSRREVFAELATAGKYVNSPEEGGLLDRLRQSLSRLVDHVETGASARSLRGELRTTLAESEALTAINLEQAQRAADLAERWNRAINVGAGGLTAATVIGGILVAVVVRRRLYAPFVHLSEAIAAYARRDLHARATPEGPLELREVAEQFNAMAEALEEQRSTQLAFLAAIAHDLKNPLQALTLAANVGKTEANLSPERLAARAELVDRQVKNLSRMVEDLLDVTRIEAGQLELRKTRFDLRELVSEVAALYRAGNEQRTISVELPDHPVELEADRVRLSQVITNLVSNALKYSPQDSPVQLRLADGDGDGPRFSVKDHGLGISPEDQARLFQPFRRGANVREAVPGVGLGLSVSRRIVLAHGGEISVKSSKGEGSTFTIALPRQSARVLPLRQDG